MICSHHASVMISIAQLQKSVHEIGRRLTLWYVVQSPAPDMYPKLKAPNWIALHSISQKARRAQSMRQTVFAWPWREAKEIGSSSELCLAILQPKLMRLLFVGS